MAQLTLEERVQRIEDAEAIRRLRYLYCEYGNLYDAENFVSLFAPGAVWDGGDAFGRQEGLEQIEQMVRDAGERIRFSAHYIMNEMIDIDGDSATGRWWLLMPCILDNESTWLFATYDDDYVRIDGRWLIKKITLGVKAFVPQDKGWAESALGWADEGAGADTRSVARFRG